ncbi:hypothetical protein SteCoe_37924 [Stentor coeruleus]|uniref:DNA recombination and repair protein Rad51-like C-terminal domain-containing protein n=1 Tax=Stentor coeruleus TaxID=5963 RepID=A0A1R2AMG8_9CILI|nr:hypothetical protein SteCoe_37924 [Stentor coeruleus]
MESKIFQYTLSELLSNRSRAICLNDMIINEKEIVEIYYTYSHSKSLILIEIIKQALEVVDIVVFIDMSFSIDYAEIPCPSRVLIYQVFSQVEFLMYIRSLESFFRSSKISAYIFIDSWTSYLPSGGGRERHLDAVIEGKVVEVLKNLVDKFQVNIVVCRKATFEPNTEIQFEFGSYYLVSCEKKPHVAMTLMVLEPIRLKDDNRLLHAVCQYEPKIIYTFTYPFDWSEKIQIKYASQ